MDYELRTIPGCPNTRPALELFQSALRAENIDPKRLTVLEVTSEVEAAAVNFHGSPSFMAAGQDLFPSAAAPGISCRVYQTDHGLSGLPPLESLRAAVRALAGPDLAGTHT